MGLIFDDRTLNDAIDAANNERELLRTALCIKEARCYECMYRGHCDLEHDSEYLLCKDEHYSNKWKVRYDALLMVCDSVKEQLEQAIAIARGW